MFSINELKQMQPSTINNLNNNLNMNSQNTISSTTTNKKNKTPPNIYSNSYASSPFSNNAANLHKNEMNAQTIESILENEKQHNKTETWNKLDKTVKIQKLHSFSEKYGKEHGFSTKDVKMLKLFFVNCLEKNKLQKTKDLVYNKDTQEIQSIPSLHFNSDTHNFTLKNIDKRISTLKSLTPKRTSIILENIPYDAAAAAADTMSSELTNNGDDK
jgi:hypothetical protein